MRTTAKLCLTAVIVALLLSTAISTATARNLSVSNQNIRLTWRTIEFVGTVTIRCPLTLEGSFDARTIPKVLRTLIGVITRAPVNSAVCTNASASTEGLPWHMTYEGFGRTLPAITEVFVLLREFLFRLNNILSTGVECRYGLSTDNITGQVSLNETQEAPNLIPVSGRNTVNLLEARDNAFLRCPANARMVGSATEGAITLLNASTRIRITLI